MESENESKSKWLLRTENMTPLRTANYKNICYSLQQNTSWMTRHCLSSAFYWNTANCSSSVCPAASFETSMYYNETNLRSSRQLTNSAHVTRLGATIFNVAKFWPGRSTHDRPTERKRVEACKRGHHVPSGSLKNGRNELVVLI